MQFITTYLRIAAAAGWGYDPQTLEPVDTYSDITEEIQHDEPLAEYEVEEIHRRHEQHLVTVFRCPPHFIERITKEEFEAAMAEHGTDQ